MQQELDYRKINKGPLLFIMILGASIACYLVDASVFI